MTGEVHFDGTRSEGKNVRINTSLSDYPAYQWHVNVSDSSEWQNSDESRPRNVDAPEIAKLTLLTVLRYSWFKKKSESRDDPSTCLKSANGETHCPRHDSTQFTTATTFPPIPPGYPSGQLVASYWTKRERSHQDVTIVVFSAIADVLTSRYSHPFAELKCCIATHEYLSTTPQLRGGNRAHWRFVPRKNVKLRVWCDADCSTCLRSELWIVHKLGTAQRSSLFVVGGSRLPPIHIMHRRNSESRNWVASASCKLFLNYDQGPTIVALLQPVRAGMNANDSACTVRCRLTVGNMCQFQHTFFHEDCNLDARHVTKTLKEQQSNLSEILSG